MVIEETKIIAGNINDFIDVPNGLNRLRKVLLTLAVSGNLITQDLREGTAEELYQEIQAERIKKAKLSGKRVSSLPPISIDDIPFEIPNSWRWIKLGSIADIYNGNSINKQEKESKYYGLKTGYPYIATKDINRESHAIDYENGVKIPIKEVGYKIAPKNSVLICSEGGNAGRKIGILDKDACFGNKLFATVTSAKIDSRYIFYSYMSDYFQNNFRSNINGLIGGISINNFLSLLLPLPPFAEQKRIVEKVDEVMKIIDELEAKKKERDEVRSSLAVSAFQSLGVNESSIALEHLSELVRNLDDVKELNKGILSLAVSGKLVSQDHKEGTAEDLYKKIQQECSRADKEHGKKLKSPLPISAKEIPFEIPKNWKWVRLEEITSILGDGLHGTPDYDENGEYYFINGNNLVNGRIEIKNSTKRVSFTEYTKHKKILTDSTIFVSINGTLGNLAFYDGEKIILGKSACYFNLIQPVDKYYISMYLNSTYFLNYALDVASEVTIKNVSLGSMRQLPIPLPPLAEQKRIVEKVDKLMKLCNELREIILI